MTAKTRSIRYTPLESQAKFHALGTRFKGFSGPVGSGKSKALCYEAVRLSYSNPNCAGLLGAPTFHMLRDVTLPALFGILNEQQIPHDYYKSEGLLRLSEPDATIYLRGLAQSDALRGLNLTWFGVDELTYTQEASWMQLEARLRQPGGVSYCGFGVWTPKGHDWVYQRFVAEPGEHYGLVKAQPFENRHITKGNPIYYDLLKQSYSEGEYEQEVLGLYRVDNTNRVYSSYAREVNLKACAYDPTAPLLWTLDFNVDPMCSVVGQRVGRELRVIDELVLPRSGTEEMCSEFSERYRRQQAPITIYGDASGNNRSTKGATDYEIVRRYLTKHTRFAFRVSVPRSNPAVRDRVALVNTLLQNAAGDVQLLIDPKCVELVKDMEQLKFKGTSSVIDKDADPSRSHLSDALGYMAWQEFTGQTKVGERGQPLL